MNDFQLKVSQIIKGLSIYIICSFAMGFLSVISYFAISADEALASEMLGITSTSILIFNLLDAALLVAVVYGLFKYYGGLKAFATVLDQVGASAVKNIANATLLMLISSGLAIIAAFLPGGGLLVSLPILVLAIIAFVLNIMGYSTLAKSTTLNELGKQGARKLFLGFILAIVAAVLGLIPVVGWIIALVLNIMYWVFLFQGWGMIKKSF